MSHDKATCPTRCDKSSDLPQEGTSPWAENLMTNGLLLRASRTSLDVTTEISIQKGVALPQPYPHEDVDRSSGRVSNLYGP